MKKTVAQGRQQLESEFMSLLEPLAYQTDDLPGLAQVIAKTMVNFDRMAKEHRAEVHAGVPASISTELMAGFDDAYREYGISDQNRKAEFVGLAPQVASALESSVGQSHLSVDEAKTIYESIDLAIAGGYSVVSGGVLQLTSEAPLPVCCTTCFSENGPVKDLAINTKVNGP